jgi:hypothetical protein
MIHSLTQAGHRLLHPLGIYIGAPHRPDVWFLCEMLGSLCLKVDLDNHDVYTLNQTLYSTRYVTTYIYSHHNTGPCSESRHATITNWLGRIVKTSLIIPCLVTTTCLQSKLIAGNTSNMEKSNSLETSQD